LNLVGGLTVVGGHGFHLTRGKTCYFGKPNNIPALKGGHLGLALK
jgi:hypothetical protein